MSIIEHLDADALTSVASALANDDVLAFSLCARALRTAQVAAKRKLKTNVRVVHWGTVALHLWAKSLAAPTPRRLKKNAAGHFVRPSTQDMSNFFDCLSINRGCPKACKVVKVDADTYDEIELSKDEYNRVAFAGPSFAFENRQAIRLPFVYRQAKGYFTVRDVCEALADPAVSSQEVFFAGDSEMDKEELEEEFYFASLECRGLVQIEREIPVNELLGTSSSTKEHVPIFRACWLLGPVP